MSVMKEYRDGKLKGTLYKFEEIGDKLEEHSHTQFDVHITIVISGSIQVFCGEFCENYRPGSIVSFVEDSPHEIVAMEKDTRILNLLKNA